MFNIGEKVLFNWHDKNYTGLDKDINSKVGIIRVHYEEGCEEDDEGDKIYIYKDYIELTIPRRKKNINEN